MVEFIVSKNGVLQIYFIHDAYITNCLLVRTGVQQKKKKCNKLSIQKKKYFNVLFYFNLFSIKLYSLVISLGTHIIISISFKL